MDLHPSRSFVCFICKAIALARQANGLPEPAIEEGLCPLVSTETQARWDLAARHIVDGSSTGPGITRRLYKALTGSYYIAQRMMYDDRSYDYKSIDEQIFLWHLGFRCLYATPTQGANCVIPSVSSNRYRQDFSHPRRAENWLRIFSAFHSRAATVIDVPGAYEPSPSTALTIEMKQEPEDELKYVSIETTALDERVWIAPRYSVEPRFYSQLSIEQTSHLQNEDINPSRWTDELDHYTRPRRTNELASPTGLRLSNELRNNVSMGTPGRSPALLIKASPSTSNALLYDVPSAMGSPAQSNEAIHSTECDFMLFNARQERGDMQSFAHYDFPTNGESSQLRYRHNL